MTRYRVVIRGQSVEQAGADLRRAGMSIWGPPYAGFNGKLELLPFLHVLVDSESPRDALETVSAHLPEGVSVDGAPEPVSTSEIG